MYKPRHREVLELMKGAYDLHTHTAPDFGPRALNDKELLEQADAFGMAGVMLKNHLDPTPARAILANTTGGYKTKAYGSAVMNLSIGGLNPIAAKYYLQFGAKIIWMPPFMPAIRQNILAGISLPIIPGFGCWTRRGI